MKFLEILEDTLKQDDRFVGEDGRILKTKVYDACMGMDGLLLERLINNKTLKSHFFVEVNGTLVFDKMKFAWVLESREFLPDSYTLFKNKIGLADSKGNLISQQSDVTLVWPYKDCVLEGGQTKEDQKRDEIFYNETLAPDEVNRLLYPKVFTRAKRYAKDGVVEIDEIEDTDNLIIKGNNLLALASLLKRYEGRVKCIYIDPPYNTGNDSFGYNDSFNQSSWLTFMKNRLDISRLLLAQDGTIFIQCDDNELAHLKVLCDEVFGEDNFINIITVKTKTAGVSGSSEGKSLIDGTEFILLYSRDFSSFQMNPVAIFNPLWSYIEQYRVQGVSWKYTTVLLDEGHRVYYKSITDGSGQEIKIYRHAQYETSSVKALAKKENITEEEVYKKYISNIYTTENAQSSIRERVQDATTELDGLISIDYHPIFGKRKGQLTRLYYIGGKKRLISWLGELCEEADGIIYKKDRVSTLWDHINWNNINKEGGVNLPQGQKPEHLLKLILELTTSRNDFVLDFFLGSGTTAAVAHKMNRRYIGVEQLNYGKNDSLVRLKNVVDGDVTGISKDVNWQGGGSFVYCELMEQNESIVSALQAADTSEEVQAILNRVTDDGLIIPSVLPDDLRSHMDEFAQMPLEQQKKLVMELIDKNKLYVNLCDMDDEELAVSDADKAFTRSFYRMDERGGM